MMPLIKRHLNYAQGHLIETAEADVRALLADAEQRARLEKQAKETISLLCNLTRRNPREIAYTITADDDVGDVVMSYYLALTAINWLIPLYETLMAHPVIRVMEERRLAARSSTGELMTVHEVKR